MQISRNRISAMKEIEFFRIQKKSIKAVLEEPYKIDPKGFKCLIRNVILKTSRENVIRKCH